MLLAAVGIDGNGEKHPLGVIEGATENTAVVQALLDNLVGRGLEGGGLPPVHHRRGQGAVQGDPQHLRPPYADPALPGPQGPQHHRAPCQALACQRPQSAAPGVGTGRRRQGRAADQELGAGAWNMTRPASPPASWRASTRSSPLPAWACRSNCAVRSPAPTSSRT